MSIKKRQILVADDEPDVNLTIKLALENEGFEVDTFDKPQLHCNGTHFVAVKMNKARFILKGMKKIRLKKTIII